MSAEQQQKISMLMGIVQCDHSTAQLALSKNTWDVEAACQAYLDNPNAFKPTQGSGPTSNQQDQDLDRALQESMIGGNAQIPGVNNEDKALNDAIMASINAQNANPNSFSYEPLAPEERIRQENTPCGIKNINQTCYFSTILQVCYNVPEIVTTIFKFQDDGEPLPPLNGQGGQDINPQSTDSKEQGFLKKLQYSRELIKQLKLLFGQMAKGDKKYVDPSNVLKAVTDNDGVPVQIGRQEDVGEFNELFLSRMQEGLNYKKIYQEYVQTKTSQNEESKMEKKEDTNLDTDKQDSSIQGDSMIVDSKSNQDDVEMDKGATKIEKILDEDVITKIFKSKVMEITKKQSASDGCQRVQEKLMDNFAVFQIHLEGYNDLHEAWENSFQQVMDGVKDDARLETQQSVISQVHEPHLYQATRTNWFHQVPKVMCLQMNRLKYEGGNPVKLRHKAKIEKTLYVDRYLIENKDKTEKIQEQVKKLRESIKHLEVSIKEYSKFGGSENDIVQMMKQVTEFFTKQNDPSVVGEYSEACKHVQGVQSHHPFVQQIKAGDQSKVKDTIQMLQQYGKQLEDQEAGMRKKVTELENQIVAAYGKPDMQKKLYSLHSIYVHDGNAESGHYFSYIFDRFQKQWRKFNDVQVTEVAEEEVFKHAEGGYQWFTGYWLIYVEEQISQELANNDINMYIPPDKVTGTKSQNNHPYSKSIQPDVNTIIQQQNDLLTKEIEDSINRKQISQIKEIYNRRYGCFKMEFGNTPQEKGSKKMMCLAAYLWEKNEKDIIKKTILAEAYREVMAKQGWDKELKDIDENSSLFEALSKEFKGSQDYPSDGVKLAPNSLQVISDETKFYSAMYLDTYVNAIQCDSLKHALKHQQKDAVTGMAQFQTYQKSELAILFCLYNWLQNGKTFDSAYKKHPQKGPMYRNRDISMDVMRCSLLYTIIEIKKFLLEFKDNQNEINMAFEYMIRKGKLLKLGLNMLASKDIHIKQIRDQLKVIERDGAGLLKVCEVLADFSQIVEQINDPNTHGKPLDESKLSEKAKNLKLSENTYVEQLPKAILEVYQQIQNLDQSSWLAFEIFQKQVIDSRANTQNDLEADTLYDFNLKDKFNSSFDQFKKMFNPIIAEVHMKLAGSNRDIDVKKEEQMAQFEKNHYKIEFSKVKQ